MILQCFVPSTFVSVACMCVCYQWGEDGGHVLAKCCWDMDRHQLQQGRQGILFALSPQWLPICASQFLLLLENMPNYIIIYMCISNVCDRSYFSWRKEQKYRVSWVILCLCCGNVPQPAAWTHCDWALRPRCSAAGESSTYLQSYTNGVLVFSVWLTECSMSSHSPRSPSWWTLWRETRTSPR